MRHMRFVLPALAIVALAGGMSGRRRPPATPSPATATPARVEPAIATPESKEARRRLYAPDPASVVDAEEALLARFATLEPRELLREMIEGPDRRSFNLMLIALENGMRTDRRAQYEGALVWAMERTSGNGIKLEAVAGLAASLGVSPGAAGAAARLLMKTELERPGADALGELAARAEADVREEARRYARERTLAAVLGRLVEDESHVRELAALLSREESRAEAARALAQARDRAADPAVRASIASVLGR